MSDISDGMAGDKTKVPSLSDAYEFNPPLSMHVRFSENICMHILFILFPLHFLLFFLHRYKVYYCMVDAWISIGRLKI